MIRAFIALGVPEVVGRALVAVQAGMPAGHPVDREDLHITLAFVGEHPEPMVEDLHLALSALRGPAFSLEIKGVGLFDRAFYAVVASSSDLTRLRSKVLRSAENVGIHLLRVRFKPHVTLARFGSGLGDEALREMRDFSARHMRLRAGPFQVKSFALYQSHLTRHGPAYEVLANYPLERHSVAN